MAAVVILVNGLPGAGKTTLARGLAERTGWPCLTKDAVKEALAPVLPAEFPRPRLGAVAMDTVWAVAAGLPGTVLVESWWFRPRDLTFARAGVATSGASTVVEVWCDVAPALARRRYAARRRSAVHEDERRLGEDYDRWAANAEPLALGPVVRVPTDGAVDLDVVVSDLRVATSAA
ncbi:AAA family ATPase [Kineococcus endophyticus]|uniref:AAA family ATPase n=1 Tax=Kineococcus endophyticus TaxID=1181883 RepID=A0ABV3P556_9ACTN